MKSKPNSQQKRKLKKGTQLKEVQIKSKKQFIEADAICLEAFAKHPLEDEEFRQKHVAKLLNTDGFRYLTLEEAAQLIDTMIQFTALAFDMVISQARLQSSS